jgi:hypothetical protein
MIHTITQVYLRSSRDTQPSCILRLRYCVRTLVRVDRQLYAWDPVYLRPIRPINNRIHLTSNCEIMVANPQEKNHS